ncbi:PAN2-PAN3 deadenylation complex subunit PAN3 isoform X1 [Zerene cesonia]|uniref:PAN2-PAN3 deadenylation complex subunit PAN3 isoform X1 n=1 Tax=Zerene cesonia TaxID=33412 RepID=UPI0018E54FA8|nr:PAN2-PAN3 deadenylation complex subunit PAN3 isoform X1 [Zerene cesonia]
MDPPIYLQYTPPNALPQESKLVTYMNRNTSTPTRALNQALGKLSLEPSPPVVRKVFIGEFVPVSYYTPVAILPESPESSPPTALSSLAGASQVHQENVGGTTYFYSTNDSLNSSGGLNSSTSMGGSECMGVPSVAYPPQMYPSTPQHMGPMSSKQGPFFADDPRLWQSHCAGIDSGTYYAPWSNLTSPGLGPMFYMPDTIRSEMYQRNEDLYLQPDNRQYPDLPENLEVYSELIPLEGLTPHSIATSFRATHRQNGDHYALRRLHSYGTVPSKRFESWKQIDHPNIIRLNECFTTKAFGDHSMMLVYDYHPAAVTLMNKYLAGGNNGNAADANGSYHDPFSSDPDAPRPYTHQKNAMLRAVACGALLPEAVLWSILVQLTAGLRAIHAAGLACRTLDPTKVVMTGCRIRIAWCGVADALHANEIDINQAQQDDLTALGRLALSLACRTIHCDNLAASMELVTRSYSPDLKNLIFYLLSGQRRSVTDLMPMIGARFYTQVEALERRADVFENQLARELDNGRLLRIMLKLSFINERPELNMDTKWSETGDRYLLKLFRDYLFHSVTQDGRPWLDQAHVSHCLNQLDGGSNNKVELMTRDEQSVLLVTFAELKHCLEQAFEELTQASAPSP